MYTLTLVLDSTIDAWATQALEALSAQHTQAFATRLDIANCMTTRVDCIAVKSEKHCEAAKQED